MKAKRYRYQIQFACFECRKAFKRALSFDEYRGIELSRRISGRYPRRQLRTLSHSCPECNRPLALMGRAFRAPRHGDTDQWRKVELLVRSGFTFWSHVGQYPDSLSEARRFVERRRRSDGETLARQIRNTAPS